MTQRQTGNEVNATDLEDESSKLHTPTFPDWLCESSKKRQKKRKKKKSKHGNTELFLPQADVYRQLEQSIHEKRAIRTASYFVPHQLTLSDQRESAFLFGRTIYNALAGKKSVDDGHIAVFGGSGSGKTTGIAVPTLHTWKGTIFSFDLKGDLIGHIRKRRAQTLYMLDGSENYFYYDPFAVLRQGGEQNLAQNARELANAIIPLPPPNTTDPIWSEAARDVLTGAIVYYFNLKATFIDAMMNIKAISLIELFQKIKGDPSASICVNPDLALNPKTLAGVSLELHSRIAVFATDPVIQDAFSASKDGRKCPIAWESLESSDIIVRIDQSRLDQWSGVVRLMLVQMIRTLERRPEKYAPEGSDIKPTLLLLDEFPQYGKVEAITSALKILRSKNVTIALFCQSLADLDETYGRETRRTILDNCPYKAILGACDAETQHYFSDLAGTINSLSRGVSVNFDKSGGSAGYGINVSEVPEPIIRPHEFASLSEVILLHPYEGGFCRLKKETYFKNHQAQTLIERG